MKTWQDISTDSATGIVRWAESQSWCESMRKCMQDPIWHAEGDVWTHTKMVVDELQDTKNFAGLSPTEKTLLIMTAVFHDSGKPATTKIETSTGRIRSPKHAAVGARIARKQLMELGCPIGFREHICHQVLFHGRPPYLESNRSARDDVVRVSTYLTNRLLYEFALADTRGRICKTRQGGNDPEEILEIWKLEAEEADCFDGPFKFMNDHARFLYYRDQLDHLHYEPFEDYRCKMTLVCGLPGAGKDTWLEQNRPNLPVVSLDEIRRQRKIAPTDNQGVVVQQAKELCRKHLREMTDFALSATNITRQQRRLWIDVGASYNARIEIVYVEPDLSLIHAQNKCRQGNANVPAEVIDRLAGKLDPPTLAECHELWLVPDESSTDGVP